MPLAYQYVHDQFAANPSLRVSFQNFTYQGTPVSNVIAVLPGLIMRDARERGLDRDPGAARQLKLIRDELATHAMVRRAVADKLDSVACLKHFQANAARYRRPAARRALVAMFAIEDSARAALRAWLGVGFAESTLAARGLLPQEGAGATTLLRGRYAEIPLFDTDADPLSLAARALGAGRITPVVRTVHGHAVAIVRAREEARPLTYAEARGRVVSDLRSEVENAWVLDLLQRLRAATPVQRFPSRLARSTSCAMRSSASSVRPGPSLPTSASTTFSGDPSKKVSIKCFTAERRTFCLDAAGR